MADTKISALTPYTTPIGADLIPIVDTTNSITKSVTVAAMHFDYFNSSVAQQGAGFASDTYLTGSNILIPSGGPYVDTFYKLIFDMTKTGAGIATPILTIRIGTAGTTADAAICVFTFGAGTAAIDSGLFEINAVFRTVGSGTSAVLQGNATLTNNLTTTGLSNAVKALNTTSSGFNSTTASLIIGASFNGGASFAGTNQLVRSQLIL